MSSTVISVENLGKRYELGAGGRSNERYTALRDVIAQKTRSLFRSRRNSQRSTLNSQPPSEFWALKDVSFDIQQGEVVGIIGRNGAGKSTLLKVLSRITDPTEGRIKIRGRVASLLEVGTGFHPELTGRENIYLNGAILGMTRAEIKSKFDEIVEFAEVEKFLDTPVKRYSSGMYVRLAFAVAAHLEPEILIVDEVLAVGDAEFQKKCLGKMQDVAGHGRTVIFVSHQMNAVEALCSRVILLAAGKIQFDGPSKETIEAYLNQGHQSSGKHNLRTLSRSGLGRIQLVAFDVLNSERKPVIAISSGQDIILAVEFEIFDSSTTLRKISFGISIHNAYGDIISIFYSGYQSVFFSGLPQRGRVNCFVKDFPLSQGHYLVGARVLSNGVEEDWPKGFIGSLDVEAGDFYRTGSVSQGEVGPLLLRPSWNIDSSISATNIFEASR